jgi:hypothetical protein
MISLRRSRALFFDKTEKQKAESRKQRRGEVGLRQPSKVCILFILSKRPVFASFAHFRGHPFQGGQSRKLKAESRNRAAGKPPITPNHGQSRSITANHAFKK